MLSLNNHQCRIWNRFFGQSKARTGAALKRWLRLDLLGKHEKSLVLVTSIKSVQFKKTNFSEQKKKNSDWSRSRLEPSFFAGAGAEPIWSESPKKVAAPQHWNTNIYCKVQILFVVGFEDDLQLISSYYK